LFWGKKEFGQKKMRKYEPFLDCGFKPSVSSFQDSVGLHVAHFEGGHANDLLYTTSSLLFSKKNNVI
jgi:hypothetical protein